MIRVAFVLEQHLGHRTFAENLQAAVEANKRVAAHWVPVHYANTGSPFERMPLPRSVRPIVRARREIKRGLSGTSADVVVFNTQVPAVIGSRAARRRPYVLITDITPVQLDDLADEYRHRADRRSLLRRSKHAWNRHVFAGARTVIAWSTWTRDSVIGRYGVPAENVVVIPPGVDLDRWQVATHEADGPVRILFVGGDFERKGGPELLEAYKRLEPGASELILVTKNAPSVPPGVVVVDDVGPNDPRLLELYRSSSIFALPSRAEAFGIAAVEASACGLPVVVADTGGLSDIVVDGVTGYRVAVGDVDRVTERLGALVDSPALRRRLGEAARARAVEHFDASRNGARLLDAICERM